MAGSFQPDALYPIVDVTRSPEEAVSLAEQLLSAGASWLQLRDKISPSTRFLALANELVRRAGRRGARLIVNDRLDVAIASGAAGVHLGQDDLPLSVVRPIARERGLVVGISTHEIAEALAAEAGGADYIGFGPMFPTPTKADALPPRADGALAAVRTAVRLPIVAIGGITLATAAGVLSAGADSVAMIGALAHASDPEAAAHEVLALGRLQRS